jgi:hypothetical protein
VDDSDPCLPRRHDDLRRGRDGRFGRGGQLGKDREIADHASLQFLGHDDRAIRSDEPADRRGHAISRRAGGEIRGWSG